MILVRIIWKVYCYYNKSYCNKYTHWSDSRQFEFGDNNKFSDNNIPCFLNFISAIPMHPQAKLQ